MPITPPVGNLPLDPAASVNLHATAVAVSGRAVLLRGPSGSGKSDLALRCLGLAPNVLLSASPLLVADDRVIVTREANRLVVTCPSPLAGLIEVRGVGVLPVPSIASADLRLVVDLVSPTAVPRMPPERDVATICGLSIPRLALAPFEMSAPLKVILALTACGSGDSSGA